MAYYTPFYQPYYAQNVPMQVNTQPQANVQQAANNGLVWVQGIEGAKAHATAPGVPALLMDSESERFFIKTVDASGMPLPLRVFEYHEVTNDTPKQAQDMSGYVTREEFEAYKQSVSGKAAKLTDGESTL